MATMDEARQSRSLFRTLVLLVAGGLCGLFWREVFQLLILIAG